MAVRFDAVGDELNRTANISSNTAFTYMMWTVLDNDAGTSTYQPYLFGLSADLTQGYSCGLLSNVFRIEVYEGGVAVRSGVASGRPALGTPACVFLRCSGTGTNLLTGGYRTPSQTTFTTAAATLGTLSPVTQVFYAGLFGAFWQDARKWNIKVWDRALSDAELLVESYFERVMYPSSLNLYLPLTSANDTADRSGNGRNPTVVGTLTTGDTIANLWRPSQKIFLPQAGVSHAATGALVGPGAVVAGSAARTRAHGSSGSLTGPGSQIVGSAQRNATHDSSGDLTGPGSTVAGSAARTRQHASSGDLTGQGSAVAGSAARTRQHAATGALTGQGSAVSGSADRTRQHASSGDLVGPGAAVSGSAERTRQHGSSGDLVGPGAVIVGSADHITPGGTHDATGALIGPGSSVSGSAARFRAFTSSGALVGPGAVVTGSANRAGAPVSHDATGVLVGPGSVVSGVAQVGEDQTLVGGFLWMLRRRKAWEDALRNVPKPVAEVIKTEAPKVIEKPKAQARNELRKALEAENLPYRAAYTQALERLVQQMRQEQEDDEEEESIAGALALLL